GNDALTELRTTYADHPLAAVARVVQGTNAAREFKLVEADNTVLVRPPNHTEANELLQPVLDPAAAKKAAGKLKDPDGIRRAVAAHLRDSAPDEAGPQIGAYVRARRREIAVELGGITG